MNLYTLEYEEKIFNDSRYEMIIRINLAICQRIRITHVKEYDGWWITYFEEIGMWNRAIDSTYVRIIIWEASIKPPRDFLLFLAPEMDL